MFTIAVPLRNRWLPYVRSMRIKHVINKRGGRKSGEREKKHQRNIKGEEQKKEDWIGVIHSINRISRKVDIKIPVECKNDKQDSKGEGIRKCT